MMARNDDEAYWNSSDKKIITFFDEDEGGGAFGVSRQGASRLSKQLRDWEPGSSELSNYKDTISTDPGLPLHQLISESSLQFILDDSNERTGHVTFSSPEELVNRLVLGIPANLEQCKTLKDKQELLALAAKSGDGSAILTATLFVMSTLSKQHSFRILRDNSIAFTHYVNYLAVRNKNSSLCHLLEALGHFRSAADHLQWKSLCDKDFSTEDDPKEDRKRFVCFIKLCKHRDFRQLDLFKLILNYKIACSNKAQIQNLNLIVKSHFNNDKDAKYVSNHVKVLEFQRAHGLPSGLTAQQSIFCAAKLPTDTLRTFAQSLGMTEKVFQWTCLRAKANLQLWNEIHAIFHTKSWLGNQKVRSLIPMSKVAIELQKAKAPAAEVTRYVQLVDDVLERQRLQTTLANLSVSNS